MTLPTVDDVQAVDPVLTNMLVGYQQAASRFVATRVFPIVPTEYDSHTFFIFDKKYWFTDDMKQRAPGGPFHEAIMGLSTDTFKTLQWALEYPIADEVARNSQVPMSLETAAVNLLGQRDMIRKERAFAADFMTTGVWGTDNAAATDWDDFTNGDPIGDIQTAIDTISDNTGQEANTMVLGRIVHKALIRHPDILDRMKYVQTATKANVESTLALIFGVTNYFQSRASYNSANEGQTGVFAPIIDDDALICHVDSGAGIFGATAGKTFAWGGGGGEGTIYRVRDDRQHADIVQIKAQWDQKVVAADLGYFFSDIV